MSGTELTPQAHQALAPAIRAALVVGLLYLFLVGITLLETGIGELGAGVQESLFTSIENPIAGLCVGILATVLIQSSSVTTSTVVGLVGAGLIGVPEAVPVVMGANVGTTVTSTFAALGHIRRPHEFKPAFAAATIHDMYNILSVVVFLPLELATGFLARTSEWLAERLMGTGGSDFESPLRLVVKRPADAINDLWGTVLSGSALGIALIVTSIVLVLVALTFVTKNMRVMVASRIERSMAALLEKGGGFAAMVVGTVITIAVQSSSIVTAILVPLAGAGVITVKNVYPVAIGANIGTTATALLAAMAVARPEALAIALVHTLFNVAGALVFYPVPALRAIPVQLSEWMAEAALTRRFLVASYVVLTFLVLPILGVLLLR